jgi:hypothetical protein
VLYLLPLLNLLLTCSVPLRKAHKNDKIQAYHLLTFRQYMQRVKRISIWPTKKKPSPQSRQSSDVLLWMDLLDKGTIAIAAAKISCYRWDRDWCGSRYFHCGCASRATHWHPHKSGIGSNCWQSDQRPGMFVEWTAAVRVLSRHRPGWRFRSEAELAAETTDLPG